MARQVRFNPVGNGFHAVAGGKQAEGPPVGETQEQA